MFLKKDICKFGLNHVQLKALDSCPLFFLSFSRELQSQKLVALTEPCFEEWGGKSIKNRSQDAAFQLQWLLILRIGSFERSAPAS